MASCRMMVMAFASARLTEAFAVGEGKQVQNFRNFNRTLRSMTDEEYDSLCDGRPSMCRSTDELLARLRVAQA